MTHPIPCQRPQRVRALKLAIAVAAVAAALPAGAQAVAPVPQLTLADTRPISLSWDDSLRFGAPVEICNVGHATASPRAELTGFAFVDSDGNPVATDKIWAAVPKLGDLPAGACVTVQIQRRDKSATVGAGSYSGLLVVTAAHGGIVRRSITVDGPKVAAIPASALATTPMTGYRSWPGSGDIKLSDDELPLRADKPGEQIALPAKGATIGTLFNNTYRATVKVADKTAGPSALDPRVITLPIEVTGATHVGHYTGTVDVAGDGKHPIKLDVMVTDLWIFAVLAILVGAAIPFLSELWGRRWRAEHQLHKRHRAFLQTYYNKPADHKRPPGSARPIWGGLQPPRPGWIAEYDGRIAQAIRLYAQSTWYFDATSDAYAQIEAALEQVENDGALIPPPVRADRLRDRARESRAGRWVRHDAWPWVRRHVLRKDDPPPPVKTADKLLATHEQRLLKFAARASAWFDDDARPRLVVAASAPLKGGPLKIGELRQRCDNAAEFGELMDRWEDLAKEVLVYRAWWEAIEKASLESVDDNLNDAEKKQLRRAKREVGEAVQELFTLQSAADFRRYEPDRNLVTAYNLLAPLAAKSGTPRPAVEDLRLPADPQIAEGGMQLASRCQAEPDAEGRGRALGEATPGQLNMVEEAERWLKSAPDFRDPSPPELRSTRRYIADALVVILAVAGGVVAGLSAFYFGKPFGTVADYVTIALVGSASAVLVRQLNHAIDLLSQSPGGPPLISKLKPTTLPATATSGAAPAAADESEAAHAAPGGSPPAARAPNRSPVPV